MSSRLAVSGKALSLLIVFVMVIGALVAMALSFLPAARGATCDQSAQVSGDWVITTPQECTGIIFTIDGNLTINAGGSLLVKGGGLVFVEDTSHVRSITVSATTALTLDNSYITTQTNVLNPYLQLTTSVSGALNLKNQAYLKFPGNLNLNAGSVLNLTDSKITAFPNDELQGIGTSAWIDDNDDSARIAMNGATAYLFRSRIEHVYENTSSGGTSKNLTLASSSLYAYDSFLAVDFSNNWQVHNVMTIDTSSNAYFFNVTIDEEDSQGVPLSQQLPAFVPSGSGNAYLLRWLHATVVDSTGAPVSGSTITSTLSPGTQQAQYPDNGLSTAPSAATRWYLRSILGLTNPSYAVTDPDGRALIPLWTDRITAASLPNAQSFGNYLESAAYTGYSPATGGVSFPPYPDLSLAANNQNATIAFSSAIICSSNPTRWSGTISLTGPVSVAGTLEINAGATVTLTNGNLYIDQSANACGFIQIDSGATLSLVNSAVWSNYPLVIDVTDGGRLVATKGSSLQLTQQGNPGLLRSSGTTSYVSLTDTSVLGNVNLAGQTVELVRDSFSGPNLTIDTSASGARTAVKIYDSTFPGVTNLALRTDYGSTSFLAFDLRNLTFDPIQTSQLVFGGTQYVQLTNVTLDDPDGTWYLNTVTGGAKVDRYWWLTINDVDGTGTLLATANATIRLYRLDPVTGRIVAAPNPVVGDTIYGTSSTTWPVSTTSGSVLYRAYMETRTSSPSGHVMNNTYIANGTAAPQGTTYSSDQPNAQASLTGNTVMDLIFTTLTPDLNVTVVQAIGGNGNSLSQPINTDITLVATIANAGQIDVRDVDVAFFSVNVDLNGDRFLDAPTDTYRQGALIGEVTIAVVPKGGIQNASVVWSPQGSFVSSVPVSAVVDPPLLVVTDGGAIRETNETNNIRVQTVSLFTWPDLSVTSGDIVAAADPVVNNDASIEVTVRNVGTFGASDATVQLYENGQPVSIAVHFNLGLGLTSKQVLVWRPTSVGVHSLEVLVNTKNDTAANRDYLMTNNIAFVSFNVHTQPDLALVQADYPSAVTPDPKQDTAFQITVIVHNFGQTPATGASVAVYLDGNRSQEIGRVSNVSVLANGTTTRTIQVDGIALSGNHRLFLVVDPDRTLTESNEDNNFANLTANVQPPAGQVYVGNPVDGQSFEPTDILVQGFVRDQNTNGIAGVFVYINVTQNGVTLMTANATTDTSGQFTRAVSLAALADGTYQLSVVSPQGGIVDQTVTFGVRRAVPFLNQPVPVLGIQWWMFLVILAAAIAVVVGVTLYFKVYGLGKMVECGECGAFIPEDATTCPKCGVEFEKDMAKCSNCQAWIPVDVKQCPECGVEFATGQVEMADYQEKMRLQYDEVVSKFKEEANRMLGRTLSEREFQDWWRKQPTFVTFEDWLREEEEMRKMGSKPCPICGTLNSVTATVCHKCGSLMKEAPRPPTGGAGGAGGGVVAGAPVRRIVAPVQAPPSGEAAVAPSVASGSAAPGTEAIPRRVIRRPIQTPQPVIQKKVIRRPVSENQQGESAEGSESKSEDTEDEL